MVFNEKLLKGLDENDRALGAVILFFIERGYNLYHFFQIRDGKMIISDDLYEDVQRLTSHFLKEEVLIPDYPDNSKVRLSNTQNLYVSEEHTGKFDVNRLRSLFPTGKKGDKKTCIRLLRKWFQDHPEENMESVAKASKAYIEYCRMKERYLRDANNFIYDENDSSMLSQWVEYVKNEGENVIDWRNKLV